MSLNELVNKSIWIIREALSRAEKPAVLWSTGKDSTVLLHLIKTANFDRIDMPVIFIDTGFKFKEMYKFRDDIAEKWGLNLIIVKRETNVTFKNGRLKCCYERKTLALKETIEKYGFDAIFVAIRRDEHGIRNKERYFSPRDKDFKWNIKEQDTELVGWGITAFDYGENTHHIRVHPLLHWSELDVWLYIKKYNLPVNPLYFANYVAKEYGLKNARYRSLGCEPCTLPVKSNASTIDEIIEEIKQSIGREREGRAQDKEDVYAMERLRSLGYM